MRNNNGRRYHVYKTKSLPVPWAEVLGSLRSFLEPREPFYRFGFFGSKCNESTILVQFIVVVFFKSTCPHWGVILLTYYVKIIYTGAISNLKKNEQFKIKCKSNVLKKTFFNQVGFKCNQVCFGLWIQIQTHSSLFAFFTFPPDVRMQGGCFCGDLTSLPDLICRFIHF